MTNNLLEYIKQSVPKLPNIRYLEQSCWLNEYIFIWMDYTSGYVDNILIQIIPDNFKLYSINLYSDGIKLDYKKDNIDEHNFELIPYIDSEEEYFQLSLIHNLSYFDFDSFKECKSINEKLRSIISVRR